MIKIIDVVPCKPQAGSIGVEIEVEADNMPSADSVSTYWRLERDASLRGESGEFVLRRPLNLEDLDEAFAEITKAMKRHETKVRPTYRAGVHVHVNVQDLTPKQLIAFISLYFIFEEVFLSYCDKSRAGNHFCLRMSDASYSLDMITDAIINSNLMSLNTEDLRYASLNVTSLFKYGSIEFRALESTTDFNKIKEWAAGLNQLKEWAKTISDPSRILGEASVMGFEEFAKVVLGDSYRVFRSHATETRILTGIRSIQYALYSRDWGKMDLNIFSKNKNLFTS
jgi:hypothetical protein